MRAFLDREAAEAARQKKAVRLLFLTFIPAGLLAVLVFAAARHLNEGVRAPTPIDTDCVGRIWAARSAVRERAIQAGNPGITPSELGAQLQRENEALQARAKAECATSPLKPAQ